MYPEEHEKKKNLEKSVDRCISMPRNLFFEYSQAWTLLTITKQRKEESFLKNYSIFSTLSKIIIRVLKIPRQRAIVHFRDRTSFHGCSPTVILRANLADRKKRPGVESFPARTKLFSNGQAGAYNFSPRPTNSVKQFLPLLFRSSAYLPRACNQGGVSSGWGEKFRAETETRADCRPTRNRARCELHFHIAATVLWRPVVRGTPTKNQFSTASKI